MAISLFDLVTRASIKLGGESVQSFKVDTREVQVFEPLWRSCLDASCADGAWNSISAVASLNQIVGTPDDPRFHYQHQLPSDFIANRWVMDQGGTRLIDDSYEIEADRVLSNHQFLKLKYVRRIEQSEVGRLPVQVQSIFVARLAYEACEALTGNSGLREACYRDLKDALASARIADSKNDPGRVFTAPSRLRLARHGG